VCFLLMRVVGSSGLVLAVEPRPVSDQAQRKGCEWNSLSDVRRLYVACMPEAGFRLMRWRGGGELTGLRCSR